MQIYSCKRLILVVVNLQAFCFHFPRQEMRSLSRTVGLSTSVFVFFGFQKLLYTVVGERKEPFTGQFFIIVCTSICLKLAVQVFTCCIVLRLLFVYNVRKQPNLPVICVCILHVFLPSIANKKKNIFICYKKNCLKPYRNIFYKGDARPTHD